MPVHPAKKIGLGLAALGALTSPMLGTNPAAPVSTSVSGMAMMANGCGLDGSEAHGTDHAAENELKNRFSFPMTSDYNTEITLQKLLEANNEDSFDTTKAGIIEGVITEVKAGGVESCNCHSQDAAFMDTHIYISVNSTDLKKQSVIVEITPRIRSQMKAKGTDWTTPALRSQIKGKHVRVSGWLFYDKEHENAAENILKRPNNWRATCWEIHPVTDIKLLP